MSLSAPFAASVLRFSRTASIQTEEDTRLKVINRVLSEVLLWPLDSISTEVPSTGGFADYGLRMSGREARLEQLIATPTSPIGQAQRRPSD